MVFTKLEIANIKDIEHGKGLKFFLLKLLIQGGSWIRHWECMHNCSELH